MRTILSILLSALISAATAYAQAAFEDSEGKSAIVLDNGGAGIINIADGSAKIGYVFQAGDMRFGGDVTGKLTKGVGTLFSNGSAAAQAGGAFRVGWHYILAPSPAPGTPPGGFIKDDWAYAQIGYTHSSATLFDRGANAIAKRSFDGYSAGLFYNATMAGNFLVALAGGYERRNNVADLEVVEVTDETVVSAGPPVRTTRKVTVAVEGAYAESDHIVANYDLAWFPDFLSNRIAIDLFGRFDRDVDARNSTFKPGLGVMVIEQGKPTHVVGGLSFESVSGKLRVGIMGGFHF